MIKEETISLKNLQPCKRRNNWHRHREVIYKELLTISISPKVMQWSTEMASEWEFIFERARYNHHINQRDDETYVPLKHIIWIQGLFKKKYT